MDGTLFDRWTRRRFGLMSGAVAALLALGRVDDAGGKKRGKKRCRKLLQTCITSGKRRCCGKLRCGETEFGRACCKKLNEPCTDGAECCKEGGTGCDEGLCKIV